MFKIKKSRNFALVHHGEQLYDNRPYIVHLDDVYQILLKYTTDEDILNAAYLHDILEDTKVTKILIEKEFNKRVADIVFNVSGFGSNRIEKQRDIRNKIENDDDSIMLKMADRLANIRNSKVKKPSLFILYKKEHNDIIHIFNKGNKKLLHEIMNALDLV